jgi:acetate kinase
MTSAGPCSSVLALNCRSSSLKFGLNRVESSIPKLFLSGEAESIGDRQGKFWAKDANDKPLVSESANFGTSQDAVARTVTFLADCKEAQPLAVGHRVVHGGPNLRRHCLVDETVLRLAVLLELTEIFRGGGICRSDGFFAQVKTWLGTSIVKKRVQSSKT